MNVNLNTMSDQQVMLMARGEMLRRHDAWRQSHPSLSNQDDDDDGEVEDLLGLTSNCACGSYDAELDAIEAEAQAEFADPVTENKSVFAPFVPGHVKTEHEMNNVEENWKGILPDSFFVELPEDLDEDEIERAMKIATLEPVR